MFSTKEDFKQAFLDRLQFMRGKSVEEANYTDKYLTLGRMIREYVSKDWINTNKLYREEKKKELYYFSMEFLVGRLMYNNIINLDIEEVCKEGFEALGEARVALEEIEEQEPDAGLGNGGLGRLAACFLDSLASLGLAGHGSGIRYKYGLFEQRIIDGHQVELPENWLREGNVWEIRRSDKAVEVRFGGEVKVDYIGENLTFKHEGYEPVMAVPYDTPAIGYKNNVVNTLRLWSSEPAIDTSCHLDFTAMPADQCHKAVLDYKDSVEGISEFLYPNDSQVEGRVLRLKQEYFLVSANTQSIIRSFKKKQLPLNQLHDKVAIHINDTHPALAVPELMRILMDVEGFEWEDAWHITTKTISYTNHTTLSEALEKWPIDIFKELLPRIFMIVEEINERFCKKLWHEYPGDWDKISRMAIIGDGHVHMAHLAIEGSHSVNGVARLHTQILKEREMKDFYGFYPHKFNNKTNGITHRRWLIKSNPHLSRLITSNIGDSWMKHPEGLLELADYAQDSGFQEEINRVKIENKKALAKIIMKTNNIIVDVNSIFDVQIKRIHAYKRQLLNIFHIMHMYNCLKDNPDLDMYPRTFIFGGKAAPSYYMAKKIIKLINSLAHLVNNDKSINGKMKVVFLENYCVSLAEKIIPATDINEQISTASKEASGTGNMKFIMNGSIIIGTMDGANVEIEDKVGPENIFTFGLNAKEVLNYYEHGGYDARDIYERDDRIKQVVDDLITGLYQEDKGEFMSIYDSLLTGNDEYFVLKDFSSYVNSQKQVDRAYRDTEQWAKRCIINVAHSGKFSSDRTIQEYASEIWDLEPYDGE